MNSKRNSPVGATRHRQDRRSRRRAKITAKHGQVAKLICKLSDDNDHTALVAVRMLRVQLKAQGVDLHTLADVRQRAETEHMGPKPERPAPIDYAEIENVVRQYAEGKNRVTMNRILSALHKAIPATQSQPSHDSVHRAIAGCLRRLGFTRSRSGDTWAQ